VIDDQHYSDYIDKAPLFLKGGADRDRLREFIKKHVKHGDNRALLYELDGGRIRPSKALADSLKGLMESKPEFVLIDEQKEVSNPHWPLQPRHLRQNQKWSSSKVALVPGKPPQSSSFWPY